MFVLFSTDYRSTEAVLGNSYFLSIRNVTSLTFSFAFAIIFSFTVASVFLITCLLLFLIYHLQHCAVDFRMVKSRVFR